MELTLDIGLSLPKLGIGLAFGRGFARFCLRIIYRKIWEFVNGQTDNNYFLSKFFLNYLRAAGADAAEPVLLR
jgi:hypothetical protein